ncbi:MAG: ABC transporter ATP-binding protein [Deltaproteobacteria bacterium]|nr:ABC transporter ATP-binding protein [Deltaproteobacteria bacterium]
MDDGGRARPMIEVERLSKSFGPVAALRDVSFHVARGGAVGFVGPNGAGKTTTLRILAGLVGASCGQVRIGGYDIVTQRTRARACMGYMAEGSPLYPEMRVVEYLRFRAELKGIGRRRRRAAIAEALAQAGADDVSGVLIAHLSRGYRQRVGLADALLGSPALLILDEPTAGLDPNQICDVRRLVKEIAAEHTVLLSTHLLGEVEATCSRALVIAQGRLVAQGTIDELCQKQARPGLHLVVSGPPQQALGAIRACPGVAAAKLGAPAPARGGHDIEIELEGEPPEDHGPLAERIVFALAGAGVGVREIRPAAASLEQIFAELTRAETGGAGPSR